MCIRDSSYAVHYYAAPKMLFTVQPGSFFPPPKVTSAVIRLELHQTPPVAPADERAMFRAIRASFGQRRKTVANAASAGLGVCLLYTSLDERLGPGGWRELTAEEVEKITAGRLQTFQKTNTTAR